MTEQNKTMRSVNARRAVSGALPATAGDYQLYPSTLCREGQTHDLTRYETRDKGVVPTINQSVCRFERTAGSPMTRLMRHILAASLAALSVFPAALCAPSPISNVPRQHLKGHLRWEILQTPLVDRVAPETQLTLTVVLEIKDMARLIDTAEQVANPQSASYRKYLSPDQFADLFGASPADYQTLLDWGRSNNLAVTAHKNRFVATVAGSAADIETALDIHLNNRRRPDGTVFFAPDAEPSLKLALPVQHISGLENFDVPGRAAGSGAGGGYQGSDFRNAYAASTTLTGAGQKIGILMLDGFAQSDINGYAALTKQTYISIQTVPANTATTPGVEGTGDIEAALSMAPAAQIVAFLSTTGNITQILTSMASRNDIKQFSSSWFLNLTTADLPLMLQLATQGQSFLQATGDSGAVPTNYFNNSTDIRLSPFVTLVGGTSLNMAANGASYGAPETAWAGSSGGILSSVPIPSYQSSIAGQNGASYTSRNFPDVSAQAASATLYLNGKVGSWAGTSLATPLWAGYMALVNQLAASRGAPSIGFANPALYSIASTSVSDTTFHDVVSGCTPSTLPGNKGNQYCAGAGYDLATGLGSPQADLINALAGAASYTAIVTSVTPNVGSMNGGTTVTVTGRGFSTYNNQIFLFGGKPAQNVTCSSSTQCVMRTPASTPGTVDVTPGGTNAVNAGDQFTYLGPSITSINPSVGPQTGGTVVQINGISFSPDMIVMFGNTRVSFSCLGPSYTQCEAGPTLPGTGSFHITVLRNNITLIDGVPVAVTMVSPQTSSDVFTYEPVPYGTMSPNTGSYLGGTFVTVTGANFSTAPGATVFTFHYGLTDSPATNVHCSSTTVCTMTTPPAVGGADPSWQGSWKVTVNGLTSNASLFTYTGFPPVVPPKNPTQHCTKTGACM
jgi:hypothetical protein